jgi:hypothetical protein
MDQSVAQGSRSIHAITCASIYGIGARPFVSQQGQYERWWSIVMASVLNRCSQHHGISRHSYTLSQNVSIDAPTTWTTVSEDESGPYYIRYYRRRGRPSMREKAQGQQYLTPPEEKALVDFILQMGAVGPPISVKYT